MFNYFVFFFTLLFAFLTGCSIEKANKSEKNELIIASDFLKSKDTILFRKFSDANNIRVKIKFLMENILKTEINQFVNDCFAEFILFISNVFTDVFK